MQPLLPVDVASVIMTRGGEVKTAIDRFRGSPKHWRSNLLLAITTDCMFNCKELLKGQVEKNISRCAWAARNLLELHYFVRYIIDTSDNAKRFHEDVMCDVNDMLKKFEQFREFAHHAQSGRQNTDHLWQHMEAVTLKSKVLRASEIAKSLGEETAFQVANKFLSKFIHPTSISMQLRHLPQMESFLLPAMLNTAAVYIEATFPALAEHRLERSQSPDLCLSGLECYDCRMKLTDDQLLAFGREIDRRTERNGFTTERINTFIQELARTKNSDAAREKALEGLTLSEEDRPLIESLLGGNPIAQLSREGWVPK